MEKRDTRIDEIINNLTTRNRSERMAIFIWGVFTYATAFSVFFSPQNIVTGGTAGLSLLVDKFLKIDTSIFVFVSSFVLLIIGYFLLGKENTIKTIFGVILLPIFLEFTSIFQIMFHLEISSLFLGKDGTALAYQVSGDYMRWLGYFFIFMGIKMATDGVLRGLGIMRPFLIANMVNLAIRLSVALICAPRFGIAFVWLAVPAGWLANFLISYAALRKSWPTDKVDLN